jgi:hypothetical protein
MADKKGRIFYRVFGGFGTQKDFDSLKEARHYAKDNLERIIFQMRNVV